MNEAVQSYRTLSRYGGGKYKEGTCSEPELLPGFLMVVHFFNGCRNPAILRSDPGQRNACRAVSLPETIKRDPREHTLVHPREVFYEAIRDNATSVIIAHNHPSGHTDPSLEDREVTRRLSEAGGILGIRILDHVIFSPKGYYSFLEHGEL